MSDVTKTTPAGWYADPTGRQRWWDGSEWQMYAPEGAAPAAPAREPKQRRANGMNVSYVRQQKGHSLTMHILLACVVVGMFTIPYYSISPNHYWHI